METSCLTSNWRILPEEIVRYEILSYLGYKRTVTNHFIDVLKKGWYVERNVYKYAPDSIIYHVTQITPLIEPLTWWVNIKTPEVESHMYPNLQIHCYIEGIEITKQKLLKVINETTAALPKQKYYNDSDMIKVIKMLIYIAKTREKRIKRKQEEN